MYFGEVTPNNIVVKVNVPIFDELVAEDAIVPE